MNRARAREIIEAEIRGRITVCVNAVVAEMLADLVEHILGPEMVRQLEDEVAQDPLVPVMPTSPHRLDSTEDPS